MVPCCVVVLFAFPVFAQIVYRYLGDEIYYRFLWLIPAVLVIAYSAGRLVISLRGLQRLAAFLGVCCILVLCGDYVYDNPYFSKAENAYHVPDTVTEICDAIIVEGREVKAVFPADMVQYVRQYTPYVCMPYGREMIVERWMTYNEMYEVYELGLPTGTTEAELLANTARKNGVHYIIWDKNRPLMGKLTDYDFTLKQEIDGYAIYLDELAYLGL